MKFAKYTTQQNDRWDLVSQRCYGTPHKWPIIAQANPAVPLRPLLDEGLELAIPILERTELEGDAALPPWKRATP